MSARLPRNRKVCQVLSWLGGNMPTTPTSPATPATPLRGRRGQMTFSLQRLPEPLLLDQAVLDPTWNKFKTFMVCLGGFAVLSWLVFGGYSCGRSAVSYQAPASAPSVATQPATPVAPPQQPQWKSYADCQRGYVLTLRQDPEGACDYLK